MKHFKPVFQREIERIAETQTVPGGKDAIADMVTATIDENTYAHIATASPRLVDRWLDAIVRTAGSPIVFCVTISGLLAWAFMGIHFGSSDVWVATISDVQAILSYVFDSFLMRQLLRKYLESRSAMLQVKSRYNSHQRMVANVKRRLGPEGIRRAAEKCNSITLQPFDDGLRTQGIFARYIVFLANTIGHIASACLYWICIFIWLGFGPYCDWSSRWQLYINNATSALMVLVFALLACLRESYADYTNSCLGTIFKLDSILEKELRYLTHDSVPNQVEIILPPKENILQMAIFYYADIVGALVGIVLLMLAIVAWAAVGPAFHFNSNWWLLIGTYAGLVGLFDSFVLRNIQGKIHQYSHDQCDVMKKAETELLTGLSVTIPSVGNDKSLSLTQHVSRRIDALSSHPFMAVAGLCLTIGCLVASSAMRWSLTGQLISNVPPSIIESFFMIILITGQNDAEASDHADLANIYYRRQRLLSFIQCAKEFYGEEKLTVGEM